MPNTAFKRSTPLSSKSTRENWLMAALDAMREHFTSAGYRIPAHVRISCGLPSVKAFGKTKRAIGECWAAENSKDKHFEIFISPTIDATLQVLATLTHELVHATVGLQCGHRGKFIECARSVGLAGPWTATKADDALAATLKRMEQTLGKYPHGSLEGMTNNKKKQGTRLIKVACVGCCYTVRTTTLWLLTGIPNCPNPDCIKHGEEMEADYPA